MDAKLLSFATWLRNIQNLLLITHIDEQQQVDVIYDTYGLIITPI